MTAKEGYREVIRSALLDNLGLKLISLFCALAVYAFIHGAENAPRTVSVSVVSILPPTSANRHLMTPLPKDVRVTLRGSRTHLDDIRPEDLGSLQLDLRSGRETLIELDPAMFHVPLGLTVTQIYPPSIELRWDDVIVRQIPVQIPRKGDLAPGLTIKGATVSEPPVVSARGPRSVVDVMQFAEAASFDVTGLTEGRHRRTLALKTPPESVEFDIQSVAADVEVARELISKPFSSLKVEVVGMARALTKPSSVTVVFVGTAEDVNALQPEAIVPRVEPKQAGADTTKPGSAYLDVLVDVPSRVKAEVQPPKVLVRW